MKSSKQKAQLESDGLLLASYRLYQKYMVSNLKNEGFEKNGDVWARSIFDDKGTSEYVIFNHLPDVASVRDIPEPLKESSQMSFSYKVWNEIKAEYMWYTDRNKNYKELGFVLNHKLEYSSSFDGLSYFQLDKFQSQVWTWPGAAANHVLPNRIFPGYNEDSVYQRLSLEEMDTIVLLGRHGSNFLQNPNLLPSVHLSDRRDHLDDHARDPALVGIVLYFMVLELRMRTDITKEARSLLSAAEISAIEHNGTCWSQDLGARARLRQKLQQLSSSRNKLWSTRTPRKKTINSNTHVTYEVPGRLKGMKMMALPDTGSGFNLLSSKSKVLHQGDVIIQPKEIWVTLPNGSKAPTVGFIELPWTFRDTPREVHILRFYVLENCVHEVVLGNHFLELTRLNTDNNHRIKQRRITTALTSPEGSVQNVFDCHLAGNILNRMHGELDGIASYVIPDTGCRVNAMSLSQALSTGTREVKFTGDRGIFRFIDGSTAPSLGVVKRRWKPTGSAQTYELEFEIMEDCRGIIIGQQFLYGNDAFKKHEASFVQRFLQSDYLGHTATPEARNSHGEIHTEMLEREVGVDGSLIDIGEILQGTTNSQHQVPEDATSDEADVLYHTIQHNFLNIEILDGDGKVYSVTFHESLLARLRRRLRGSKTRCTAISQITSTVQERMVLRARAEEAVCRILDPRARILAIEAEIHKRRTFGEDESGNAFLLSLLPQGHNFERLRPDDSNHVNIGAASCAPSIINEGSATGSDEAASTFLTTNEESVQSS